MFEEIWQSFWRLPVWVRVWIVFALGPANLASVFFLDQPMGSVIAVLAYCGIAPNFVLAFVLRGLSRLMALSHILFWSPLMLILAPLLAYSHELVPAYATYVTVLFVVNAVSLGFDFRDTYRWFRGDRAVF